MGFFRFLLTDKNLCDFRTLNRTHVTAFLFKLMGLNR